jgi:alpha,alpha-trehalose phosphorylase
VTVRSAEVELVVEDGVAADLAVRGEKVRVEAGEPVTVALDGQGPHLEGQPMPVPGRQRGDGSVITATVPGT